MIGLLSGTRCHMCGKALEAAEYVKNEDGDSLYWADPKISPGTSVRLDFCGLAHSAEWHAAQIYNRQNPG